MKRIPEPVKSLPITPADPHSPVPLYHQIYLDLKRLIADQTLAPGSLLPPETEISQLYGVGRQTIRQTIARLVDEDLVERYPGRGTFVKSQSERLKFYLDRSFTKQTLAMGYRPSSKVLCVELATVDRSCPEELQGYIDKPCMNLERLRLGDGQPICYQGTTLMTERCPGIEKHDFGQESLYEVLARDYQLAVQRIDYVVRALAADDYRAELLAVEPGSPLLSVKTVVYLEDKTLIEYTVGYYRADLYQYSTSHSSSEK